MLPVLPAIRLPKLHYTEIKSALRVRHLMTEPPFHDYGKFCKILDYPQLSFSDL